MKKVGRLRDGSSSGDGILRVCEVFASSNAGLTGRDTVGAT